MLVTNRQVISFKAKLEVINSMEEEKLAENKAKKYSLFRFSYRK